MASGCKNKGIKGLEIVSKIELQRLNFVFLKELLRTNFLIRRKKFHFSV